MGITGQQVVIYLKINQTLLTRVSATTDKQGV